MNVSMLLRDRELHPFPMRLAVENALEDSFIAGNACKFDNPLPPSVSSTIAIAMSCDGQTFATTHGDHTVKVFDFISGEQIRVFRGHPRTPWTIKYHPTDPNIIASGCLGFEVRVWHIEKNCCLNMNTYSQTIISLAFHPVGYFIAVACGMSIQLWDWQNSTGEIEGTFPIIPASVNTTGTLEGIVGTNGQLPAADGEAAAPNGSEQEFPINWRGITHTRNIRAVLFHPSGDYIFAVAPDSPKQNAEELAHCRLYACEFAALLNIDTVSRWGANSTSGSSLSATEVTRAYEEDQLEDLVVLEDPIFPLKLSSCRVLIPQIHLYSDGGIDISKDGRYLLTCARVQIPPISLADLQATQKSSSSKLSPASPTGPPLSAFNYGKGSLRSREPEPEPVPAASESTLPPLFTVPMRGAERVPLGATGSSPTPGQSSALRSQSLTPPPSAPPAMLSFAALRNTMSTMSALTGLSASSSSDFLSVQSGSTAPQSGAQSPLPPAPATPGAPPGSAPGTPAAGNVVSPTALAFSPPLPPSAQSGADSNVVGMLNQMSLTSTRQRDADGTPLVIDMTTKRTPLAFETPEKVYIKEEPDLKVHIKEEPGVKVHIKEEPGLKGGLTQTPVGHSAVESYNSLNLEYSTYKSYIREASTRKIYQCKLQKLMSRAGQVRGWKTEDHLCVFEINFTSQGTISKPTLLNSKHLPGGLMKAVTSAKLSGSCRYALIGYGVRVGGQVPDHARRHAACEVVSVQAENMRSVAVMSDFEDEVNIAQFHPSPGHGIVYGTKRGKIRTFSKA